MQNQWTSNTESDDRLPVQKNNNDYNNDDNLGEVRDYVT